MIAIHGRMQTVGAVKKPQKALLVGSYIISPLELNSGALHILEDDTPLPKPCHAKPAGPCLHPGCAFLTELQALHTGDTINAYTPAALFLGSATIQSVQYTTAPKAAAPDRQDIVFGGTFKGYTWLNVRAPEQFVSLPFTCLLAAGPRSCRLLCAAATAAVLDEHTGSPFAA